MGLNTLGADFHCGPNAAGVCDVDADLSFTEEGSPDAYLENIWRRLTNATGCLFYDPTYGRNVLEFLLDTSDDATIAAAISAQCMDDERTKDCTVDVLRPVPSALSITIRLTTRDGDTYEMSITVDAATGARWIQQREAASDSDEITPDMLPEWAR